MQSVVDAVGETIGETRNQAVAELHEEIRRLDLRVEEIVAKAEERLRAAAGSARFPPVKLGWSEGDVVYEGEFCAYQGNLYQARQTTGRVPGGLHWALIVTRGEDGRDGVSLTPRGAFDLCDSYAEMDVVEYMGASYMARRDNPGVPGEGDGWQQLSERGKKGDQGERGLRGPRGEKGSPALAIDSWKVDPEHYFAIPFLSDGRAAPPLRLRDLFVQFRAETAD
jgi:hypothetical protein